MSTETTEKIRKAAVLNAIRHDGKADPGAVLGNLLGENSELRSKAKELMPLVRQIVQEVNSSSFDEMKKMANEKWPDDLAKEKPTEERQLPPLPNAQKYSTIVTRIAPNPDFALHIGNARAAILSHDYARMYKGKFIVRFEDTDPRLKKAQLIYYDLIREDLKWLGCEWDEECIQSDRLPLYYEVGEKLLSKGAAYVCECGQERFRELVNAKTSCPDRGLDVDKQVQRWRKMLTGGYREGEAVFRVKTDIQHPNPAIRDWPGFRIIDTAQNPHPRVGSKYCVWPLYNMASGVDDHMLGITHVIRGKEHVTNMARQLFLYDHMGWKYPDDLHYGRLKVEGMNLSKSRLMKGVEDGEFSGVDDPRLGTLAALRRRGYLPDTIRKIMWDVGPKPVDVTISWDNINSQNRKLVDPTSHRYFFVPEPIEVKVSGVQEKRELHIPLHPQHPEMGTRTVTLQPEGGIAIIYLARSDKELLKTGSQLRLMNLFNIKIQTSQEDGVSAEYLKESVTEAENAPILQWVPDKNHIQVMVVMPDASVKEGLAELGLRSEVVGSIIQFVRFGFCRVDSVSPESITVYFAHQ